MSPRVTFWLLKNVLWMECTPSTNHVVVEMKKLIASTNCVNVHLFANITFEHNHWPMWIENGNVTRIVIHVIGRTKKMGNMCTNCSYSSEIIKEKSVKHIECAAWCVWALSCGMSVQKITANKQKKNQWKLQNRFLQW